ncbi:hypothetical protein HPB49_019600 [Dermacentor silvarum]|uniref:Uncharacterized protein n=1 Tax=Dermacentor silvarum TaxID=543639 RepID=A0ACB8DEU8_DERSI|nr:hypothetical protein HPB49_019600 [Dermacentor silvarum]
MIDWVSIVRHSRRRFSNYMYAMPSKVRRRRKHQVRAQQRLLQQQQQRYDDENRGYQAVEPPPRARFSCSCCIPSRKSRRVSTHGPRILPTASAFREDGSSRTATIGAASRRIFRWRVMGSVVLVPNGYTNHRLACP